MKFISSEFISCYSTYSFGYRNYVLPDNMEEVSAILNMGYLPRLHNDGVAFYMARSGRVCGFEPTSENRRVLKKFDQEITVDAVEKDSDLESFFIDYFDRTHGAGVMTPQRLKKILHSGFITHVLRYRAEGADMGYVLLHQSAEAWYYWYAAWAPAMDKTSFGMYMMLDCARRTTAKHLYVGTVVGNIGRYKTNLPNFEFWTGSGWSTDLPRLKKLLALDAERQTQERSVDTFTQGQEDGLA